MWKIVTDAIKSAAYYLLEQPLRTLYMKGPSIKEYGFWEGRNATHICTQLIKDLEPEVWFEEMSMQRRCDTLIERKFTAFYVAVLTGLYVYVSWHLAWWALGMVSAGWRRLLKVSSSQPNLSQHLR